MEGEEIAALCDTAYFYDAVITADGRLLAWGEVPCNWENCLMRQDNSENDDVYDDVYKLPLKNITGAWLGSSSILALDQDGTLWGMGSNSHGQLWNAEAFEGWDQPVRLTDHVVSARISNRWYSAAIKDDGGVWLMGSEYTDYTGERCLSPTRIATVKRAAEFCWDGDLCVRDKDGVSWRLGVIDELLKHPKAAVAKGCSGKRGLREDLWLTDEGELVRTLSDGGEETLLTDVVDVDLSFDVYSTALTKDGDLYIWSEKEAMEDYGCSLTTSTPTKVMEGVKLAGGYARGVTVVNEADGAVWAIHGDTLNAALEAGTLVTLPVNAYAQKRRMGMVEELYHRPFEELPRELRDSLKWDGKIETIEGYSFHLRTYTAPGITVVTTEAPEEVLESFLELQLSQPQNEREVRGDDAVRAEIEGEKGREWVYAFTLEDDRYATELGLKVGSTLEEAEALGYTFTKEQLAAGTATFGVPMETFLDVTVDDGVVTRLEGSFGLGRYVGKYWDI